jgi:septal ring factor EnvC (AmiA/AmiB activator)
VRGRIAFAWFAMALVIAVSAAPALGQRRAPRGKPAASTTLKKSKTQAPRARRAPAGSSRKLKKVIPIGPRDLKGEQRRLQQTQKQLKEERERAEQARRREGSVLVELEQVGRRLADKRKEVARLDTRIRGTQADVTALQRDIARLERRRASQEALLASRLRAIYKVHVQGGAVPVVLSGDDPIDRAMAVRYLTTLAALDARLIQEYRETSAELADRKSRSEERQRELTELRGEASREQAEVDREAARRRVLLGKVRDERAYHERMVGELTESSRRLEAFIRELEARQRQARELEARKRQAARATPPTGAAPLAPGAVASASFRGRLQWPAAGRVAATFGEQVHPRFGTRTYRNGLDIEAPEGTAVEAVLPGQVVYTGWFKGYGNLIIIDHGGELFTLYAHVSEIHVKEGDDVRQGQRIGAVGDTGSLSGPRLYFEVRYRGKPQDPGQWLRPRG